MKPASWNPSRSPLRSARSWWLIGLLFVASLATAAEPANTTENLGIPPLLSGRDFSSTDPQLERLIRDLLDDPDRVVRLVDRGRAHIRERQGATATHAELLAGLATRKNAR